MIFFIFLTILVSFTQVSEAAAPSGGGGERERAYPPGSSSETASGLPVGWAVGRAVGWESLRWGMGRDEIVAEYGERIIKTEIKERSGTEVITLKGVPFGDREFTPALWLNGGSLISLTLSRGSKGEVGASIRAEFEGTARFIAASYGRPYIEEDRSMLKSFWKVLKWKRGGVEINLLGLKSSLVVQYMPVMER